VSYLRRPIDVPLGTGTVESPRLVVDVWPAVRLATGWRLILLRRTVERGGFWQGVSGRVEAFDRNLEAAALREIQEETGIASGVEVLDLDRWVEFVGPRSGLRFRKRSMGAVLPAGTTPSTVRLSHEHVEARWADFAEARALVSFDVNREEIEALELALSRRS
jgi:8-oxo-dGTP pyrophosphatase MutT (NUDIX family)